MSNSTVTFNDSIAHRLLSQGKYKEAMIEFHKLIATVPSVENYIHLAEIYTRLGANIHAIEALQHALSLDSKHAQANILLVQAYIAHHQYDSAKDIIEWMVAEYPSNLNVIAVYSQYLTTVMDYKKAQTLTQQLLERSNVPSVYNNCAIIEIEMGNLKKAIEIFDKAIDFALTQPLPPKIRDQPFMDSGSAKQALFALKKTLDELGIPFLLYAGTLLGIYRDGDILPHDKDIDVAMPWNVPRLVLINAIKQHGFICNYSHDDIVGIKGQWNISVVHQQTGCVVDFFFLKPEGNKILGGFDKSGKTIYSYHTNTGRTQIKYAGQSFWTFGNPDEYLKEVYGKDWRVSKANYNTLILGDSIYDPHGVGLALGYNQCISALVNTYYKKSHGLCMQLLSVHEDKKLEQLQRFLEQNVEEQWYEPIPKRSKRSNHKELFGIDI